MKGTQFSEEKPGTPKEIGAFVNRLTQRVRNVAFFVKNLSENCPQSSNHAKVHGIFKKV